MHVKSRALPHDRGNRPKELRLNCPQLQRLELDYWAHEQADRLLGAIMNGHTQLHHLSLAFVPNLTSAAIAALRNLPWLQHLDLNSTGVKGCL